ncbi:MAG TPA: LD-carboxypeptidase [Candidatus Binataceae bacterium]|nr:LD-carboxypeptidase [Candidatus Binataceae bacterium]
MPPPARIKPPALQPGATIGVVASASAIDRDHLDRGVAALSALGYRVKLSSHVLDRSGILAGDDRTRAAELAAFFADPGVDAIFAARGGYGCGRLLPMLDFAAIARSPKIFLGFSDVTFILNALVACAGMACFHGPMVAMDFARGLTSASLTHLRNILAGDPAPFDLPARRALRPGAAEGEVIGGCLSCVAAALGTPFAPPFDDAILFLEDTGEKAYRIDRMMVHLEQAGALARIKGLVFGAIRTVDGSETERRLIEEFVADRTARLPYPVLWGLEAGHGSENFTLPFGVRARLDAEQCTMTYLDRAVS